MSRLVRPADRVATQNNVDRVENRADVQKARPVLGAVNQQALGSSRGARTSTSPGNGGDTGATRRVADGMAWCGTTSRKGTRKPRTR